MYYLPPIKPISHLKTKAAIQDNAPDEETQETLALLKLLALGNHEIEAGKTKPLADVVRRLRKQQDT